VGWGSESLPKILIACRARLARAEFVGPQIIEETDVLVFCVNRPGGVPGKRYRYESGWLEQFVRDLQAGYFLA
jgi:hypothetical protein